MKWEQLTKTILICTLLVAGTVTLGACGKKEPAVTTTTAAINATTTTTAVTAAPTPAVPAISGTLAPNVIGDTPTWVETAIDPAKTMYVKLESGFLKIRKGPGKDYDQIGTLTNGMPVTVIAKTDTNWYKLQDGFYVSGDYVTETVPAA